MATLLRRTLSGLAKSASLTAAKSIVDFVVLLWLIRILRVPEPFGAFFFVFVGAELTLKLSNLGGYRYLIQRRGLTGEDVATVTTAEVGMALLWAPVWWFAAPLYLQALGWGHLVPAARVMTLWTITERLGLPARSLLERDMHFGRANGAYVVGTVVMGVVAVSMALTGWGLMALICGKVAQSVATTAALWVFTGRAPRAGWSREAVRELLRFGLPITASDLLVFYLWNVPVILIGQILRDEALIGLYYAAFKLPEYMRQLQDLASNVVYPAFTKARDDEHLREGFRLVTKYSAAVGLLPVALVAALGRGVTLHLLGTDYLGATLALLVFTALAAFRMTTVHWYHAFVAKGRTRPLPLLTGMNAVGVTLGALAGLAVGRRLGDETGALTGVAIGVALSNVATILVAISVFLPQVLTFRYGPSLRVPLIAGALSLGAGVLLRLLGLDVDLAGPFWAAVVVMAGVYVAVGTGLDAPELRRLWGRLRSGETV
jgi:O-antigen/teichoic acid export membrane protein